MSRLNERVPYATAGGTKDGGDVERLQSKISPMIMARLLCAASSEGG